MESVDLPVMPPLEPMLAKAQAKVPDEPGVWSYEPKWDGFRALAFRDGDEIALLSRSGKDLGRYFPELLEALRDELAPRCVLDGEVVVPREIDGRVRLDWESLSQRIHPAASRIKLLAEQTPAHFIGFDALATADSSLLREPFRVRRAAARNSGGTSQNSSSRCGTSWRPGASSTARSSCPARSTAGSALTGSR